jgi:hypothetical protein
MEQGDGMEIPERIAVLEANHKAMKELFEQGQAAMRERQDRTEARLTQLIAETRDVVLDRINALNETINGNGKRGLVERVLHLEAIADPRMDERISALERDADKARGERNQADRTWVRVTPLLPYFVSILAAAAAYYIGKGGHI